MTKAERHFNQASAFIFGLLAITGLIGVIAGHHHHIMTAIIGIIVRALFINENKKTCRKKGEH